MAFDDSKTALQSSHPVTEYNMAVQRLTTNIDIALRHWLETNFHPLIARYHYMWYVVDASNQNARDGYIDASSNAQLWQLKDSYADGKQLRLTNRVNDGDCITLLANAIARFAPTVKTHVTWIRELIPLVIDSQVVVDNRNKQNKADLERTLEGTLQVLALSGDEINITPQHFTYVDGLFGKGSQIMQDLKPFIDSIDVTLFNQRANGGLLAHCGILLKHDPFVDKTWGDHRLLSLDGEKGNLDMLPLDLRKQMISMMFFNDINGCVSRLTLESLLQGGGSHVGQVITDAWNKWGEQAKSIPVGQFGSILSSEPRLNQFDLEGYQGITKLAEMLSHVKVRAAAVVKRPRAVEGTTEVEQTQPTPKKAKVIVRAEVLEVKEDSGSGTGLMWILAIIVGGFVAFRK